MNTGEWDAIIIGSGLGGVSAAAVLARSGLKVLLCEQDDGLGGLAHAFQRDGRTFDSSVHVLAEGEMVLGLLDWLGVADQCELTLIDHFYRADFPGMSVFAPTGPEEFMEAHIRLFPHEAEGIRSFFRLRHRMFLEMAQAPMRATDPSALGQLAELLPTLMRYRTATLAEVMDEHLRDPRLKAMCSALWPYLGAPPSQLSFTAYAQFIGVLVDGPYHCKGSFQRLVDAFVTAVEGHGGTVLTGTSVERILLTGGKVAGVRTAAGDICTAPVVISNADALQTFDELLGTEQLPEPFVKRLRRLRPSMSACAVYAATTQDVPAAFTRRPAHETFKYRHWDHQDTWRDLLGGRPGGMWLSVPTMVDPDLAPPGEHLLIATAIAPYELPDGRTWAGHKERFTRALLGEFESVIPGLRDHLTFVQTGTPRTIERFSRNHRGATYGWALRPNQIGGKRLAHRTPVPGLYLSGHWTEEGPSSFRTILSGMNTAREVLDHLGTGAEVPTFKPDDLPQPAL